MHYKSESLLFLIIKFLRANDWRQNSDSKRALKRTSKTK